MNEDNNKQFSHIKIHTQYSICEGALKIEDLPPICKKNKIKAIGLCDSYNLCGALEFSESISFYTHSTCWEKKWPSRKKNSFISFF